MEQKHRARGWRLIIQRMVSWPPVTDFFSRFIHYLDLLSLRVSQGRFSPSGFLAGWEVVTLTTIGAKSGLLRTLPLVGIPHAEKMILIASNFGRSRHPAWYYNLRANPKVRLVVHGQEGSYLARQATDAEYELYWQMAVEKNIGFKRYQERAGSRRIPITVLSPQQYQDESSPDIKDTLK